MLRPLTATLARWRTYPARRPLRWLTVSTMVVAFFLYAATAAPGIVAFFDDTLEFQTVAPTFAIAHPSGYPLYTLSGGVWTRLLPVGTWAGRMNWFSSLHAALAVGLVAALGARLARRPDGRPNLWAGAAAASVLGLGPLWWSQATVAEVYALHAAFVAAILLVALGIEQTLARDGQPTPAFDRRMTGLALLCGLSLTHHRTTLLIGLPVLVYLLATVPGLWRPRRIWRQWAVALFGPLLLYLYLPLAAARGASDLHGSYRNTWAGFWEHVLARGYAGFFVDNPLAVTRSPGAWGAFVVEQVGWAGLALAAVGLVGLGVRRDRVAAGWWLVLGCMLITVAFGLAYRVPDPEVFLLPALLCLAPLAGGGVALLADLGRRRRATLGLLLLVVLVALPAGRGAPPVRAGDWRMHDRARLMAVVDFPPGSRVLGIEGEMTALRYMQHAEGLARHAQPVAADDPARRRALLEEAMAAGAPVYLTRELAGIDTTYSFSAEGALVRVWPRGQAVVTPLPATTPLALLDGAVVVAAMQVDRTQITAQPYVELQLDWRVASPVAQALKLSLRALHADGAPLFDAQGAPVTADLFPLRQVALTPAWPVGETIRDVHYLALPDRVAETPLRLLVVVYGADDGAELGRTEIMF